MRPGTDTRPALGLLESPAELSEEGAAYAANLLHRIAAGTSSPEDLIGTLQFMSGAPVQHGLAVLQFMQSQPMLYGFAAVLFQALRCALRPGGRP